MAESSDGRTHGRTGATALALLLVVLTGVVLGVIAFIAVGPGPQWPLTVTRTRDGWRLSSPRGLSIGGPAVSDRYLAFLNGHRLELMDLQSGKVTVLATPAGNGPTAPPAVVSSPQISGRYVAWGLSSGAVRVYDLARRRSFAVRQAYGDGSFFLDGNILCWQAGAAEAEETEPRIFAFDLGTKSRRTIVSGRMGLAGLSANWVLWEWTRPHKALQAGAVVKDLKSGAVRRLTFGPRSHVIECYLAGDWIVWQSFEKAVQAGHASTTSVQALSARSGRRRVVATHEAVLMSVGGGHLLWHTSPGNELCEQRAGGGQVIRFAPSEPIEGVIALSASGRVVAWTCPRTDGSRATAIVVKRLIP